MMVAVITVCKLAPIENVCYTIDTLVWSPSVYVDSHQTAFVPTQYLTVFPYQISLTQNGAHFSS